MKNKKNIHTISNDKLMEKLTKNKKQIKIFMGYKKRPIPAIIEKKLEEELAKIDELLEPIYYYQILTKAESTEFWEFNIFKKQKPIAKKLALIVYTIGSKLEKQIENYSQNSEMIRGLILDKAGVVALDSLKDIIIEQIQEETGLKRVWEIYPANEDFTVKGQQLIYNKLKNKFPNLDQITINQHYQLNPIKSVAVAIVLGKEEVDYDRCELCKGCMEIL